MIVQPQSFDPEPELSLPWTPIYSVAITWRKHLPAERLTRLLVIPSESRLVQNDQRRSFQLLRRLQRSDLRLARLLDQSSVGH